MILFSGMRFMFGSTIFAINLYNIKNTKAKSFLDFVNLAEISAMKGCIYGATFPFSFFILATSYQNSRYYNRHFIPGSIYGNYDLHINETLKMRNGHSHVMYEIYEKYKKS